jgi:hypothetical protein
LPFCAILVAFLVFMGFWSFFISFTIIEFE